MNIFAIILQVVDTTTSSGIIDKLVDSIITAGPMAALFLLICIYLGWKLYNKEKEVKELNDYIRENDKENLRTLNDVNNTLDKVLEAQKTSDNTVGKEIQNTKDFIILKIDNLSDKIDNLDNRIDKLN